MNKKTEMKLIMESWRGYINEPESNPGAENLNEEDLLAEGPLLDRIKSIGNWFAKAPELGNYDPTYDYAVNHPMSYGAFIQSNQIVAALLKAKVDANKENVANVLVQTSTGGSATAKEPTSVKGKAATAIMAIGAAIGAVAGIKLIAGTLTIMGITGLVINLIHIFKKDPSKAEKHPLLQNFVVDEEWREILDDDLEKRLEEDYKNFFIKMMQERPKEPMMNLNMYTRRWLPRHYDNRNVIKPVTEGKEKVLIEDVGENEATYPFRIFCDMDGVLVDLIGGLEKELRKKRFVIQAKSTVERTKQEKALMSILSAAKSWDEIKKDPSTTQGQKQVLGAIEDTLGENEEFWASTLEPTPDAHKLWGFISKYDPYILSHPWDGESKDGKEVWCNINLDPAPSRVLLPMDGDKEQYALNKETGAPNILIDDMRGYLDKWEDAGGVAIEHTTGNAGSTINKLVNEFKKYKKEEPE